VESMRSMVAPSFRRRSDEPDGRGTDGSAAEKTEQFFCDRESTREVPSDLEKLGADTASGITDLIRHAGVGHALPRPWIPVEGQESLKSDGLSARNADGTSAAV
jgi:hypothetical protein